MKVNGTAAAAGDHLEVRPTMESFQFLDPAAPAAASVDHRRRDRELLQTKVDELERLYAAHKLARGDSVGELIAAEFDGDLLLKMVDDLERNMKLCRSPESERGRWYGEYSARREVKLREELGLKGAQKRRKMKVIAAKFEENWDEMMAKNATRRREQQNKEEEDLEEEEEEEEAPNTRQKPCVKYPLINDDPTKSPINVPGKVSSTSNLPILKPPRNPSSPMRMTQPRKPSSYSLSDSSHDLRKENMKPPMRLNKADAPLRSTKYSSARSKSSVSLGELKDLSSMNSVCSSNPARQRMESSKSSKVLGKKDGDGSGTVKTRDYSKGFETQGWIEDRSLILQFEMDSEEPRTSREILESEEKGGGDGLAAASRFRASGVEMESVRETLKLFVHVESSHAADRELANHLRQSAIQEEPLGGARARKKWGTPEKPSIATGRTPDNLLKDVAKQFKKLMRFRKKGKKGGNAATSILAASTSSDSGGDEDGCEMAEGSSEDLKKSRSDGSIPAYAGLYEGKIFAERVGSPSCHSMPASPANTKWRGNHRPEGSCSVFSLLSFHGRGRKSRLKCKGAGGGSNGFL